MPAAAAIIAATAVTAMVQNNQQRQARKDSNRIAEQQMNESRAAQKELQDRSAKEESDANAISVRDQARARLRSRMAVSQGRSSTILTSPVGIPASSTSPTKTLLGS